MRAKRAVSVLRTTSPSSGSRSTSWSHCQRPDSLLSAMRMPSTRPSTATAMSHQ